MLQYIMYAGKMYLENINFTLLTDFLKQTDFIQYALMYTFINNNQNRTYRKIFCNNVEVKKPNDEPDHQCYHRDEDDERDEISTQFISKLLDGSLCR